jgi:hypothetical protein
MLCASFQYISRRARRDRREENNIVIKPPIFDFEFLLFGAMITEGFDRNGHNSRTFFEEIAFFSIIQGKETIISSD